MDSIGWPSADFSTIADAIEFFESSCGAWLRLRNTHFVRGSLKTIHMKYRALVLRRYLFLPSTLFCGVLSRNSPGVVFVTWFLYTKR